MNCDLAAQVDVKQIKRRVKAAFQRRKGKSKKRRMPNEPEEEDKFYLESDVIRDELKKAKDLVLIASDTRNGLAILEAVTDEFVAQGTEVCVLTISANSGVCSSNFPAAWRAKRGRLRGHAQ